MKRIITAQLILQLIAAAASAQIINEILEEFADGFDNPDAVEAHANYVATLMIP